MYGLYKLGSNFFVKSTLFYLQQVIKPAIYTTHLFILHSHYSGMLVHSTETMLSIWPWKVTPPSSASWWTDYNYCYTLGTKSLQSVQVSYVCDFSLAPFRLWIWIREVFVVAVSNMFVASCSWGLTTVRRWSSWFVTFYLAEETCDLLMWSVELFH